MYQMQICVKSMKSRTLHRSCVVYIDLRAGTALSVCSLRVYYHLKPLQAYVETLRQLENLVSMMLLLPMSKLPPDQCHM